jgi:hypothetical protein
LKYQRYFGFVLLKWPGPSLDAEQAALVKVMKAAIAARHGGVLPKALSDEDARLASQAAVKWQAKQAAER